MKTYLGDGAYAEWDGYSFIITAENGVYATDRVVLEPKVWRALMAFVKKVDEEALAEAIRRDERMGRHTP